MPGGQLITPRTLFATDKRVIIRDPNALGLRADLNSVLYSQINNVKLEKGAFTSAITIKSGQFEAELARIDVLAGVVEGLRGQVEVLQAKVDELLDAA